MTRKLPRNAPFFVNNSRCALELDFQKNKCGYRVSTLLDGFMTSFWEHLTGLLEGISAKVAICRWRMTFHNDEEDDDDEEDDEDDEEEDDLS